MHRRDEHADLTHGGAPDLVRVARALESRLGPQHPGGYLEGKTVLRDELCDMLRCSQCDAEELVDLLEGYGFLEFDADPRTTEGAEDGHWYVQAL
jgi:hypothetical protein